MKMYDAIIVGAGPAGCAGAFDLCRAGRSVLLIDRRRFPRLKACAGGLTVKTVNALRYSIRPVIRHVTHNLRVGKGVCDTRLLQSSHPIAALTVRSEFDHYCLEKTIGTGAEFKIVKRINNLVIEKERVFLITDSGEIHGRFVIGADGANSRIRKLMGESRWLHSGLAIEACLPMYGMPPPDMEFDFGVVQGGYGWIFPKGDHVNVGLYSNARGMKLSRKHLATYVEKRLGLTGIKELAGQQVSLGGADYHPASNRVFLAGDAAGLIDPLLGEGIYNAIRSGQAAASAIESELSGRDRAIDVFKSLLAPVQTDVASCRRSATWFYGNLQRGYRLLTSPVIRYALMKGFAMSMPFCRIKKLFYLTPFFRVKVVDDLVRR
ncbi:MAG: geranylgeranyl reductase family protein [Gammaproteobacteria bacterium]